jgi:sec-independent protein translocase protein TatC
VEPEAHDAAEGTFISHLVELRNRLIHAVIAVFIVFVPLAVFAEKLFQLVAIPLLQALPVGNSMIATEPASPFLTPIKLAFAAAVAITIPYLLYQLWAFVAPVAPGLYKHERKLVVPLLVSSTVLFYAGMAFAYFVVLPLAFKFFVGMAPEGVEVMTDIRAFLSFVLAMFFAFGIAFEVPIAIILLSRAGVIDPDDLASKRAYVAIGTFVVAMLLTPPDAISQTLLAIPMLLLFEVGIFVSRRMKRASDENSDEYSKPTEESVDADRGV